MLDCCLVYQLNPTKQQKRGPASQLCRHSTCSIPRSCRRSRLARRAHERIAGAAAAASKRRSKLARGRGRRGGTGLGITSPMRSFFSRSGLRVNTHKALDVLGGNVELDRSLDRLMLHVFVIFYVLCYYFFFFGSPPYTWQVPLFAKTTFIFPN